MKRTNFKNLGDVIGDALRWQEKTFPLRTPQSISAHLLEEATELSNAPSDAEEMADVALLLFALANECGIDLAGAVKSKLRKNKLRDWGAPDANGVVRHVIDLQEGMKK